MRKVLLPVVALIRAAWSDQCLSGELAGDGTCLKADGDGTASLVGDGDGLFQTIATAKKVSDFSADNEHELGDGGEGDKELILEDFRSNLSACMQDMVASVDDDKRKEDLDLIYQAEVLKKAYDLGLIEGHNIVDAALLAARDGAHEIAVDQFRNALLETFAEHNMTSQILEQFLSQLDNMAHLCNDSDALVDDEVQSLLSTPEGEGEAESVLDIPERLISRCTEEALDLEWFFAHAASISGHTNCGTMVDQEIKSNLGDQAVAHASHIQTVLALHNEENQLGHDYAKHFKHVTDGTITNKEFAYVGMEKLRNALLSDLSKPTRAKLRHLENKNFAKIHGASKRELCAQRDELKAIEPDHYSVQSDTVYTKMYKCMCEDDEIFLVCKARYHEDIVEEQPHAWKLMQQAVQEEKEVRKKKTSEKSSGGSSVARANGTWVDPSGGGPCKVPVVGIICLNAVCCKTPSHTGLAAEIWGEGHCFVNPYTLFTQMMSPEFELTVTAALAFFYGWPAVECAFKIKVTIGVGSKMSGHWTEVMVNFNIFITLDLCIGGTLGMVLSAIGWAAGACKRIGEIRYYPFIGKLSGTLNLPLFNIGVASAWAKLTMSGPVHDVTGAVKTHVIQNADQEAFLRNAFRVACPGCRGTSAAALVSYDESSDAADNIKDAASLHDAGGLGLWRRRRRRRRERRRRDRRRNICVARPCNGGSAKEYWRAKMEDARGGLSLKITGEICAGFWGWPCTSLVSWDWTWDPPAITGV